MPWKESSVIVPLGYKVTLDEGVYTVKLPKGMKKPSIKQDRP